jgi:hypothetical protein
MIAWTKVANFGSGLEADLAVEQLRGQGIPAQARGNDIVGIFGPGFQGVTARGVDVFVPSSAVQDARDLLGLDDEGDSEPSTDAVDPE